MDCQVALSAIAAQANAEWLSRDPIAERGGINLYGYTGNDPINEIDPTGKTALEVALFLAIGIIIFAITLDQLTHDSKPTQNFFDKYHKTLKDGFNDINCNTPGQNTSADTKALSQSVAPGVQGISDMQGTAIDAAAATAVPDMPEVGTMNEIDGLVANAVKDSSVLSIETGLDATPQVQPKPPQSK